MTERTPDELWKLLPCGHDPVAEGCNRYRVTIIEWLSYDVLIDASSKEAAEELAAEAWSEIGGDAFRFRDSGTDSIEADLVERGRP